VTIMRMNTPPPRTASDEVTVPTCSSAADAISDGLKVAHRLPRLSVLWCLPDWRSTPAPIRASSPARRVCDCQVAGAAGSDPGGLGWCW
jgi:hypothetical protein